MVQTMKHATQRSGTLTFLVGMLVPLALATSQAQAINSIAELTVVDATGKTVGKLIDTGAEKDFVDVVFQVDAKVFVKLFVRRDSFDSGEDLAFESTDCSGAPYFLSNIDVGGPSLFAKAAVAAPGHTLYVEDTGAASRTINVGSLLSSSLGCESSPFSAEAIPALKTVNLDTLFTPPFRLTATPAQSASCCGDCNGDRTVTVDEILTSVNYALNSCPAP